MGSISNRASAGLVLSFIFTCALCVPARGDLLNTISGTVGGVVSGTLGGAVTGTLGGTGGGGTMPSGPAGSVTGFGTTPMSEPSRPESPGSNTLGSSVASAVAVMAHQQFVAQVLAVTPSSARVRLRDGSTRMLAVTAGLASTLRAFVGKTVMLRSVDGIHLSGIVGRNDAVRGTVTAIDNNNVTMVSPNGETFVVSLAAGQRPRFGAGARVIAVSHDFGRTVQLSPISGLADAYLGKVAGAAGNTVTLRMGNQLQSFAADSAMVRLAAAHAGQTVAVDSPDGLHVKSLLSSGTLLHLAAVTRGTAVTTNGISAAVTAVGRGKLTAQLPNGDLQTFAGNVVSLQASSRVPIVITPLDRTHFRVQSGTHVATLADANLCVTVNASCRSGMQGRAVSVAPESLSVRMGNGDVSTFLGNVAPLGVTAGVPITVTPLDKAHASVASRTGVANLMRADTCVTINSGCTAAGTSPLPAARANLAAGNGTPSNNLANVNRSAGRNHAIATAGANRSAAVGCVSVNSGPCASSGSPNTVSVPATKVSAGIGNGTPPNNLANTQRSAAGNNALVTAGANQSSAAGCVSINAGPCVSSSGSMLQSGKVSAAVGNGAPSNNLANQSRSAAGNDAAVNAGANRNAAAGCVSINAGSCLAASSAGGGTGGNGGNGNGGNGNHGGVGSGSGSGSGGAPTMRNGVPVNGTVVYAAATCGSDGRVIVSVADIASAKRIAGAKLHLIGKGRSDWAVTRSGAVIFAHVPSGTYRLQATRVGYKPILSPAFQVQCAVATTLKVRMARTSSKTPARSGR